MSKIASPLTPKVKSLDEQKADFTSEGSPPPGKVSTSIPVTPVKTANVVAPTPATMHGIRKRQPSDKGG